MEKKDLYRFFNELDRAYFIDNDSKAFAGDDRALPIGYGQTISQPSLVLEMTSLLSPDENSRVLEIGTGSGYQTALLAEFSKKVYTVERIKELAEAAKKKLDLLGYDNIEYKIADGSMGWPENEPYDRIMVTAAAEKVPNELIEQLKIGGRMLIPIGEPYSQELMLVTKDEKGKIENISVGSVIFVELVGKYGWSDA